MSTMHPVSVRFGGPLGLALSTSIVLILIFCGYGIAMALIGERNREGLRLEAIAELQSRQIADWLRERQGDAELVRASTSLAENFRLWRSHGDQAALGRMTARLTQLRLAGGFEAVGLYDDAGGLLWGLADLPHGTTPEFTAARRAAAGTGRSQRVGPYLGEDGRARLDYLIPLAETGDPPPMVLLRANPADWLYPTLQTWPSPSASGETFLFRRDGDQVLYLNPLRFHAGAVLELRLPVASDSLLAARLLRGETSGDEVMQGTDYRGEPVLGVAQAIAGTDWFLAAKLDLAEIRANAGLEVTVIALAGLLALLIAVTGTRMVRHRQQLTLATAIHSAQAERLATLWRLSESEQRFLATFEQAAVGIALVAPDGRWLRVNRRLCEIVDYDEAELLERTFQDITHPDDLDTDLGLMRQMLAGEIATYALEKRYRRKGGDNIWINLTVSLVRREDGAPDYCISVVEDIHARKLAESRLALWNTAFERAELNLAIGDAAHQRLLAVNPAFAARRGYRPEEMVGMPIAALFPADRLDEVLQQVQEADTKGHHLFETEHQCRDGERFPVLLDITVTRSADGRQATRIVHALDISARLTAVAARRESDARLREAQRIAGLGHWDWDIRTDRHRWSEEVYQIYGRDPALPPAQYPEVARYFTPESWAGLTQAVEQALAEGTAYQCDAEVVRPDGNHRWITARGETVRDATGQPILLRGTVQDISARKAAEQALSESEERLRLFIDHAPAALAMFDCEMRYLAVSRRWLEDYGLLDGDVLGHCHYAVFAEIGEDWKAVHRRALGGEIIAADEDRFERADGRVQWLGWEVRPWHGADGGVGGIVIFSEDITARKLAELALLESQELLRTLFGSLPDLVWLKDPNGVYLTCNARVETLFGAPEAEIVGRTDYDFVDREQADSFRANDLAVIAAAGPRLNDEELTFASDGHRELAQVIKTPIYDSGGQVIGVLGIYDDITGRNAIELVHPDDLDRAVGALAELTEAGELYEPIARAGDRARHHPAQTQ